MGIPSAGICLFAIVSVCGIGVIVCQDSGNGFPYKVQNSDEEVEPESEQGPPGSSCQWVDAPEQGSSSRSCSTGRCRSKVGSYRINGTVRFTKCNKHYVLVKGYNQDICVNGEWSSSGHECVPCGKSPRVFDPVEAVTLIIAGYNSSRGDFPWMVAIYTSLDGRWTQICGGTLISPTLVLTAAHCLSLPTKELTPDDIKIGIGKLSLDYFKDEPGSSIVPVRELVRPERYLGHVRFFDLDIALIVLKHSVNVNNRIMPACIDWQEDSMPRDNEFGLLAGWGKTEFGGSSSTLKWTFQKYISYDRCRQMMSAADLKFFAPDKFCALDVNGGKADKGDSGGGLTMVRDGAHFVYGVVSNKLLENERDMRLYTSVLSDVHLNWLREKWNQFQKQHGNFTVDESGGACSRYSDCPDSLSCVDNKCKDLCATACGDNSDCRMAKHQPVCKCKRGFEGNPYDSCIKSPNFDENNKDFEPGSGGCVTHEECPMNEACVSGICENPCKSACDEDLFCEAKRHTPVCFNPGKVKRVHTLDAEFQYTNVFPAPSGSLIRIKVKARNDALFMLSDYENPTGSQPYYEIVFGGWANTKSAIRRDRTLGERAVARASNILSDQEYRGFWIKFDNGTISVGKENEIKPFMEWTDPSPLTFRYIGVNTGFGSSGDWILYGCSSNEDCPIGEACMDGVCANPCINACEEELFCEAKMHTPVCFHPGKVKRIYTRDAEFQYTNFFPAPKNPLIRLKVKARNDALYMLSEVKNPLGTQPYYEIVLGGWANAKSAIRRDRTLGEMAVARSNNFLHHNEFRGFWIKIENGTISVGKENERPFMEWTDPEPLKIKYFSLNTGFGSTGQWIVYDT